MTSVSPTILTGNVDVIATWLADRLLRWQYLPTPDGGAIVSNAEGACVRTHVGFSVRLNGRYCRTPDDPDADIVRVGRILQFDLTGLGAERTELRRFVGHVGARLLADTVLDELTVRWPQEGAMTTAAPHRGGRPNDTAERNREIKRRHTRGELTRRELMKEYALSESSIKHILRTTSPD
ncbi:MAG: hypothetical protein AB7R89_11060 [Dehalococcoidia bacterium]